MDDLIPVRARREEAFLGYPEDLDRIVRIAARNGCDLPREEAARAWQARSEALAAGWLTLPDGDDELWREIKPRLERADGSPLR